jgi:hypothetical protein
MVVEVNILIPKQLADGVKEPLRFPFELGQLQLTRTHQRDRLAVSVQVLARADRVLIVEEWRVQTT